MGNPSPPPSATPTLHSKKKAKGGSDFEHSSAALCYINDDCDVFVHRLGRHCGGDMQAVKVNTSFPLAMCTIPRTPSTRPTLPPVQTISIPNLTHCCPHGLHSESSVHFLLGIIVIIVIVDHYPYVIFSSCHDS